MEIGISLLTCCTLYRKDIAMKNKTVLRVIAIVLAVIMLMSVGFVILDSLVASANTGQTRARINSLRQELQEYQRRRNEVQTYINAIDFERRAELARKSILDDRIMFTGMEIDIIEATIEQYEILIIEKEEEVVRAQEREDDQFRIFRTRVRDMEENGVISYLEILFDSTSFADLLARMDFITDIMRADEQIYHSLVAAREATIEAKEELEATRLELEEERVLLYERKDELAEQVAEADALIYQLLQDREAEQALHDALVADENRILRQIREQEEELRRQEAAAAAAAAAARSQQNAVRGTGELTWPVPGHRRVSSPFGIRQHPVFGVMRAHNGIDIPAPHGTNVVASDRGTVITSSYNSSFGNFIVISHGNMNTLYAHLQSRAVRVGDVVQRGQVIGRVGSTGISTGPHLHFEVHVNGQRVNPQRFL